MLVCLEDRCIAVVGVEKHTMAKVATFGYNVSRTPKPLYLCIAANLTDIDVKELCLIL
jgi:hypothetical protein